MDVSVLDSIDGVDRKDWNAIAGSSYPFLRHEFLAAAERTGCVAPETGWLPRHLVIGDGKRLRAAMPLYEKTHSWGEFVFDWAWANAYHRAGFAYYPKLVSAVPFTPARSRRLLLADPADAEAAIGLVRGAVALAVERECSSVHVLFPLDEELPWLEAAGLEIRKDCQFHWRNRGYRSFDDFLATFSSSKRKKARRERRRVAEAGITFRHLHGGDLDAATWRTVHRLISLTFMQRGSLPYFDLEFFLRLSREQPQNVLVILAEERGQSVAAAVFFESSDTLYGRYWGSDRYHNALHFETCYYQGIDYCIAKGIGVFEPGTQGEHKVSRGFVPETTWSAHWLAHPEFFSAIRSYLDEESRHVARYMEAVDARSPYRRPDRDSNSDSNPAPNLDPNLDDKPREIS